MHKLGIVVLVLLMVGVVRAQSEVEVVGSGKTGTVAYGETVTGTIEVSDANTYGAMSFVGHNGADRSQGDFDVWYFDAKPGDYVIVRMTATSGDLIPTLLLTADDRDARIVYVNGWDYNPDGDQQAGMCFWGIQKDQQYGIVAFRQDDQQTGDYSLTVERVEGFDALHDGSETAVCGVGTFAMTKGSRAINIRSNPGTDFSIAAKMQPGSPYSVFSTGDPDWTHILYWADGEVQDGYVAARLIRLTGEFAADQEVS
jgi:hypothetical protein